MKIEGNAPSQAIDLYRKVDTQRQTKVDEAARTDQGKPVSGRMRGEVSDDVSISDEARLRAVAQDALATLPELRQDKVDKFTALIESGEYNPKSEDIAENMLNSSINIKI
ncbi:flagellar biosynthesis anti-sigma factor FlgM [bacterium]|nr:flagellar biosynthesis anti-sigma factor FlgM [bacterium]